MSETDPKVDAYFRKEKRWRDELAALRAILLDCPVQEEFKWRGPCYTCESGNIAMVAGLKNSCVLSFFKGVLLKDPKGILVPPGKNSRSARLVRFTSIGEIAELESTLKAYVREAVENERAGLKVEFKKDDLDLPEELLERLGQDPELEAAWQALTPGRRRGYVLHFSQPKQSKTRVSRIEKARPRILDGKGMHDR